MSKPYKRRLAYLYNARPKLQSVAEQAVKDHIPDTTNIQTALVSMNPKTGEVAALVGGTDYNTSQFNRATQVPPAWIYI